MEQYTKSDLSKRWAPEIIIDENGQYYIAAYRPKGIFMAKLKFIETTTPCKYD